MRDVELRLRKDGVVAENVTHARNDNGTASRCAIQQIGQAFHEDVVEQCFGCSVYVSGLDKRVCGVDEGTNLRVVVSFAPEDDGGGNLPEE